MGRCCRLVSRAGPGNYLECTFDLAGAAVAESMDVVMILVLFAYLWYAIEKQRSEAKGIEKRMTSDPGREKREALQRALC